MTKANSHALFFTMYARIIIQRLKYLLTIIFIRFKFLPKKARDILQTIKEWNVEHGFGDSEYIFLGKDGSYISALVDSNLININKIREMVGHEDERTTLKNYTFNRKSEEQTQEDIEMALALQKV